MADKRGASLLGGLVLLGLGFYFLLDNLDFDLPGLGQLWPIFPMLGGLVAIWGFLRNREGDVGLLVPGCGGFLVGLFFFAITLGPLEWNDLNAWWPLFPIIGGVTFLSMFVLAKEREPGFVVPGLGGLLVGLFFLLLTVGPLRWEDMDKLWPAFPILGGLTFFGLWLAQPKDKGPLAVSGCAVGVGVVAFLFTFGTVVAEWIAAGWPILLVVIGIGLVVRSFVRRPL